MKKSQKKKKKAVIQTRLLNEVVPPKAFTFLYLFSLLCF